MKILKYKYLNGNKYKITLDNDDIILYEDIIIKYNILLKKEISLDELNKYLDENKYYELYYKCINYINIKLRSKGEIEKYLRKYTYDEELISKIVTKLVSDGFLNDSLYAKSYVHDAILFSFSGPLKIKNTLLALGINRDAINDALEDFNKDLCLEKIEKYINKKLKTNKDSVYLFKEKVLNYLVKEGYERELINSCLNNLSFDDTNIKDDMYNKLYNKLSKKYSGKELEYKIKQKMYAKGFRY